MSVIPDLAAIEVLEAFRSGALTPFAYARELCARNRERGDLEAWAWFDEAAFLNAVEAGASGPLAGIPVAVKDIFDTAEMPTECGTPLLKGRRPLRDAAAVAALRAAGGVVMGKTVTTEFANAFPGPTRNPHDLSRTPGGSSSGSAAVVAAGIAPLALGTQTAGSIIRPAAFCGVVGFKPTFGRINRAGCLPFSESLDTVGVFARTVDDAWLIAEVISGVTRPAALGPVPVLPRIGLCRTPEWDQAAPETIRAIDATVSAVERAGARVREIALPPSCMDLVGLQKTIMAFEAAQAFAHERRGDPSGLSPQLSALLAEGCEIHVDACFRALELAKVARQDWERTFEKTDVVISASTIGEAPEGLENTGDPVFNRAWTLLGGPCLHLPTGVGPSRMPVGVQLIGRPRDDLGFMMVARWIAKATSGVQ